MQTAYDIGVRLSMETAGFGTAAGFALRLFGDLEGKATSAERAVDNLAKRFNLPTSQFIAQSTAAGRYTTQIDAMTAAHDRLSTAMGGVGKMVAGAGMTFAGVGILSFFDRAAQKASELQTTMTQVQLATNATPPQMAALQALAVGQGLRTQFSLNEEAGLLAAMTKAGIAGPGSIGRLQQMLPAISNFAEVQKMTSGADPRASATTAVEFAHLYGQYDALGGKNGPGVNTMIDYLGRALAVTPASAKEFQTLISQFAGQVRPLYGDNRMGFLKDSMSIAMLEAQLGQVGRGGTQLSSMIGRTLGAGATQFGARTSGQDKALRTLSADAGGLSFYDKNGQFAGMSRFLSILEVAATKDKNPRQVGELFKQAFGAVGVRQAGILADPITVAQFGKIGALLDPKTGMVDLAKQREAYNATPAGQAAKAGANWDTFQTLLGTQVVPVLTAIEGILANVTERMVAFTQQHPLLTKIAVGFAAILGAVLAIAGPIVIIAGAFDVLTAAGVVEGLGAIVGFIPGLITGVGGLVAGFTGLDFVLSPFILGLGAVGVAAVVAIAIFENWDAISLALGQDWDYLTIKLRDFTSMIDKLAAQKNAIGAFFQGLENPINPGQALGQVLTGGGTPPKNGSPKSKPGPAVDFANPYNPGAALGHWVRHWMGVPGTGGGGGMMPTAAAAQLAHRGGTPITIHIHPGAAPIHIHPAAHQSAAEIAREAVAMQSKALAKDLHDSLNRQSTSITSLMPSTHAMRTS